MQMVLPWTEDTKIVLTAKIVLPCFAMSCYVTVTCPFFQRCAGRFATASDREGHPGAKFRLRSES